MWPLTETRPKHLLPVGNTTVISRIIDNIRAAGIDDIVILVGWKRSRIEGYLKSKGLDKVTVVEQQERLGTAHAIGHMEPHVKEKESFIAINGDILIDKKVLKSIIDRGDLPKDTVGMMCGTEKEDIRRYGVLFSTPVDKHTSRLSKIIEKPEQETVRELRKKGQSAYINAGVYMFSHSIFDYISKTPKSARGEYEITDTINMILSKGKNILTTNYGAKWLELSYPWDLLGANEHVMEDIGQDIRGKVEEGVVIKGNVILGREAVLKTGTYIEGNVVIGEKTRVGPNCYLRGSTVIGRDCHIGGSVEIKNSIVMDRSNVPHHNYVGDSIIGENCNLGSGTKVGNLRLDDSPVKAVVKGKLISTSRRKLGTILGDNVKTGINANLYPGTMVGRNSFIGPGASAKGTIESGSRVH